MYITIMDSRNTSVTTYMWDVVSASTEEVEVLIDRLGYHLSEVSYMTSDEEPYISTIEINDITFMQNG